MNKRCYFYRTLTINILLSLRERERSILVSIFSIANFSKPRIITAHSKDREKERERMTGKQSELDAANHSLRAN